jgi:hypothetical protein
MGMRVRILLLVRGKQKWQNNGECYWFKLSRYFIFYQLMTVLKSLRNWQTFGQDGLVTF